MLLFHTQSTIIIDTFEQYLCVLLADHFVHAVIMPVISLHNVSS